MHARSLRHSWVGIFRRVGILFVVDRLLLLPSDSNAGVVVVSSSSSSSSCPMQGQHLPAVTPSFLRSFVCSSLGRCPLFAAAPLLHAFDRSLARLAKHLRRRRATTVTARPLYLAFGVWHIGNVPSFPSVALLVSATMENGTFQGMVIFRILNFRFCERELGKL